MARTLSPAHLAKMKAGRLRAAKLRGKTPVKKVSRGTPKKVTAKKPASTVKRAKNPIVKYTVKVDTKNDVGYLSGWTQDGPLFDTDINKSLGFSEHDAKLFALSVFSNRARVKGLKSVEVVKK